jgi:myo-inositol-1(or 4)-monophosphatase
MKDIIETGIKAAREAGTFLLENSGKIKKVTEKVDRSFVTDIDTQTEKIIVERIQSAFPEHNILGEEQGAIAASGEYLWIIDPLDGTHNYIRNIPLYGVSIGIVRKEQFVAGIIYMPEPDDMYVSEEGSGAFKNDMPISVSGRSDISTCTLSFDSSIRYDPVLKPRVLAALGEKVFNVRMFGASTALLTLLAEGKIDISIEFDDKPWDFAAGASLITEAGGKFTDFSGKPATYKTKGYVASNGFVHDEVCNVVKTIVS